MSLAVWTSLPEFRGWAIVCLFMLSRTLSALSLACFPLAEGSGLARSFAEAADRAKLRNALIALTVLLAMAVEALGAGSARQHKESSGGSAVEKAAATLAKECPSLSREQAIELIQKYGTVKRAKQAL